MALLFALDLVLVLGFAYGLTAVLRPPTRPAFLISGFILVWADLVFTAQILSLLNLVTPGGMLAGHSLLTFAALILWRVTGRPSHPRITLPSVAGMLKSARSNPDLWALGLAVGLGYALLALVIVLVPPNNLDSFVYHLTKVAYWIQHKTLAPWQTPCLHQTLFPLNAEIGSLESMVFLHSDLLAGFVQWLSALGSMAAVFGLARGFGSSRTQAAYASCLYLSLPMIILQATTTQTDLTAAAIITAMFFLLMVGLNAKHRGMLILSGAALGLALGTKLTAFMILPGFVIGLAYIVLRQSRRMIRLLLLWAGACLAGFIVLGAFNYVQGARYMKQSPTEDRALPRPPAQINSDAATSAEQTKPDGNPVLPNQTALPQAGKSAPAPQTKPEVLSGDNLQLGSTLDLDVTLMRFNVARDLFSFLDLTGVPQPPADFLARVRSAAGQGVLAPLLFPRGNKRVSGNAIAYAVQDSRPPVSEASSFFGPLGFFLWLPLVLYWAVAGWIKRDARLIPALGFLVFMLILSGQYWVPFRGRYYCLAMALSAPLVAFLYDRGRSRAVFRGLVLITALAVMTGTILTDAQKPLVGPQAIWGKTRRERRTVLWGTSRIPARVVYEDLPRQGSVATILRSTDPEYVWFGENLERTLTPIFPPPTVIDLGWLRKKTCDVVVG